MSNDYCMHIYTLDGKIPKPCHNILEWSAWMHKADRTVKKTIVGDDKISTVFIGINSVLTGEPLIFETMIFGGDRDGEMWRYATWEEAEEGHDKLVTEVLHNISPPSNPTDRFRLMDL